MKACFVHSGGFLSGNSCANIPELTTSWCSISLTVRTNAFIDHGGFPLWAMRNWSRSSLRTPAVCYTINWRLFTTICIYLHQLRAAAYSCCFQFYGRFSNRHPGSYCWWLHRQRRGRLAGVCVVAVYQWVMYWMYRLPIGLISIRSLLAAVIVFPWYAGVE